MLDLAAFQLRHPEFANVDSGLIQVALDDAAARLSASVFGDSINEAHSLLTSHILAMNPWGAAAQLKVDGVTTTTYGVALETLIRERGAGYGVT